jgi:hypothetical protein
MFSFNPWHDAEEQTQRESEQKRKTWRFDVCFHNLFILPERMVFGFRQTLRERAVVLSWMRSRRANFSVYKTQSLI